jgi:NAD-dependent SIR2 family protein deacetylase
VDGHFQRAGFDEECIVECHGSLNWLQCTGFCRSGIWPVDASITAVIDLDKESMRASAPFPACLTCGALARPNVLMFGDMGWDSTRTRAQEERLEAWLSDRAASRLVIVECGAGTAVPSVRYFSEETAAAHDATFIRINIREPHAPIGQIELAQPALEALTAIDKALTAIS